MQLQRFKAIVDRISNDITRKDKKIFRMMSIIKPAPRDEMGDSLFKDDIFPVIIPQSRIPLVKDLKKGDKVAVDLFLTGSEWFDSNNRQQNSLYLKLYRIEVIPKNQVITETINVQKSH